MDAGSLIRQARELSGLSLRELGERAHTSHSTLSAYENGRTVPTAETLGRILNAAGCGVDVTLTPRTRYGRGDELVEALELAATFPVRHTDELDYPAFGST